MKTSNEYAALFGRLYDRTPKAVFAAVAYSFAHLIAADQSFGIKDALRGLPPVGPWNDVVIRQFLSEWKTLHENEIIPQQPPKEPTK